MVLSAIVTVAPVGELDTPTFCVVPFMIVAQPEQISIVAMV